MFNILCNIILRRNIDTEDTMDKILVFIPMYNCENQIPRVLAQLKGDIQKYISEVIVVNNRSTDKGVEAASEYAKQNLDIPVKIMTNADNYWLGGSHKVAFHYAIDNGFDYVITLHGDDQGRINDFTSLLESGDYRDYDCVLGSRFVKGSKLIGYSKIRIWGNHCFNLLFTLAAGKSIKDLGSGLNLYKVETLKNEYFEKFPDALYFNAVMVLAHRCYKHKIWFYPITWREDDQVSNMKFMNLSTNLLKMCFKYFFRRKKYIESEMRDKIVDEYISDTVFTSK